MQTAPFTHQDPWEHAYLIVFATSDTEAQPGAPWNKGILFESAGTCALVTVGGETVTFTVAAGFYLRGKIARVLKTGTTVGLIVHGFN